MAHVAAALPPAEGKRGEKPHMADYQTDPKRQRAVLPSAGHELVLHLHTQSLFESPQDSPPLIYVDLIPGSQSWSWSTPVCAW